MIETIPPMLRPWNTANQARIKEKAVGTKKRPETDAQLKSSGRDGRTTGSASRLTGEWEATGSDSFITWRGTDDMLPSFPLTSMNTVSPSLSQSIIKNLVRHLCPLPIFEKKSKPLPFVHGKLCGSFHGFATLLDAELYKCCSWDRALEDWLKIVEIGSKLWAALIAKAKLCHTMTEHATTAWLPPTRYHCTACTMTSDEDQLQ